MSQEINFKLTKEERLSGRKRIENLYAQGTPIHSSSIRVMWIDSSDEINFSPVKIMFSAPKKKFKKAVTRNRIKRLMREAYRKNKHELYTFLSENEKNIHLSLVFTGNAEILYAEMENKIILTLQRLIQEIKSSLAK